MKCRFFKDRAHTQLHWFLRDVSAIDVEELFVPKDVKEAEKVCTDCIAAELFLETRGCNNL